MGYIEGDGQTVLFQQQRSSSSFLLVSSMVQAFLTASQSRPAALASIPTSYQMASLLLLALSAIQADISLASPLLVSVTPPIGNDNNRILHLTIGDQASEGITLRTSVEPMRARSVSFSDRKTDFFEVTILVRYYLHSSKIWEKSYSVDDDDKRAVLTTPCKPASKWWPFRKDDDNDEGSCLGFWGQLFSGGRKAPSGILKKPDEGSRLLDHSHTTVNSCTMKQITNGTFSPVQVLSCGKVQSATLPLHPVLLDQ